MTNTDQSFDHLDIINAVLGLAYNFESYPNHLFKAGYKLSRIEPIIGIPDSVNPDILFMSENRGLFAECKGGKIKIGSNLRRYDSVQVRHLIEKGIDIPTESLELDVGIFGRDNLIHLKEQLTEKGIDYPQVILDKTVEQIHGRSFKDPKLNALFSESVEIKSKAPLILKFTHSSPVKKIAPFIFTTLMSRLITGRNKFKVRDLTEEVMGDIWDNLDKSLQNTLVDKMKKFLRQCKTKQLTNYLKNSDDVWSVDIPDHWKSRKKFSDDCNRFIRELDQKDLFYFFRGV
ncbi:hypothetical protein B6U67_05630 [Methanosarcinales archaeon ex4484_138]|nr:MAG: hypothetical protein B6U67_05630 [Methanosarcinales archaeon ex4484_138]